MIRTTSIRLLSPFIILLFCTIGALADNIIDQKKELEQIKQEMDNSQKSLDSIKNVEQSVLKEINNYDQQAAANQAVLKKLNNKLSAIRKEADKSKGVFEISKNQFESAQSRYLNNLRYYYTGSFSTQTLETDEINSERDGFRKLTYLRALASYDKEDLSQTSDYLTQAENEYDQIVSEEQQVGDAQKQKRSEFVILSSHKEKKERDLSKLRRKKELEADRLLTLSETARQMEDLIARLEKARKERDNDLRVEFDFSTGHFVSYKGGLPAPMKGKITSGYGWKTDKVTNLKSFSPGIEITGTKKSAVNSVARGVIAYIGTLRGYGNFLIVEHEDGYYSMYSGLDNLIVVESQVIDQNEKLGNTPTGVIKFELRKGREAIDPIEWIKIDSF